MTALEEHLRFVLNSFDIRTLPDPFGPDVTVFGPAQPERSEASEYPAILRTCRACGVQWRSEFGCWYCGGAR